jgi:transposase
MKTKHKENCKKQLSPHEREVIFESHEKGDTFATIAERHHITTAGAYKIWKKVKMFGSGQRLFGSGRPRKTTRRDDSRILRESTNNPRNNAQQVGEQSGVDVSTKTVHRRLKDRGLNPCVAAKKPLISKRNKKLRLLWAKEHVVKPIWFWRKIIWTDESKFELINTKSRIIVYRRRGERYKLKFLQPTVKHGGGNVMLWASFGYNGTGNLEVIDGKMTARVYKDILERNVFESARKLGIEHNFIWQQDNDPKHTATIVKKWFNENRVQLLQWCAQSPDFNPIEHLWKALDNSVPKSERRNKNTFIAALKKEWSKLDTNLMKKLVDSMPRRCQEAIRYKGGPTKY